MPMYVDLSANSIRVILRIGIHEAPTWNPKYSERLAAGPVVLHRVGDLGEGGGRWGRPGKRPLAVAEARADDQLLLLQASTAEEDAVQLGFIRTGDSLTTSIATYRLLGGAWGRIFGLQ